jgi:hypothetical protein
MPDYTFSNIRMKVTNREKLEAVKQATGKSISSQIDELIEGKYPDPKETQSLPYIVKDILHKNDAPVKVKRITDEEWKALYQGSGAIYQRLAKVK